MVKKCDHCGNEYDKPISVSLKEGQVHHFDSFQCAINALAPKCENCEGLIIGPGIEAQGAFFCNAHCARSMGRQGIRDRTDTHQRVHA